MEWVVGIAAFLMVWWLLPMLFLFSFMCNISCCIGGEFCSAFFLKVFKVKIKSVFLFFE